MTISKIKPVTITSKKQRNFAVLSFDSMFLGQNYAEMLWSNCPEKRHGSG